MHSPIQGIGHVHQFGETFSGVILALPSTHWYLLSAENEPD